MMFNCMHVDTRGVRGSCGARSSHTCSATITAPARVWRPAVCRLQQAKLPSMHSCLQPSSSQQSSFLGGCGQRLSQPTVRRRKLVRSGPVHTVAMVNVDLASPALLLGSVLIGCGVLLLQMRQMQKRVSRDGDIVVAAMISIVGGTLIFQGWRLDPLLLLSQAMTISIAFWYGLEAFKLRSEKLEEEDRERRDLEKRGAEVGMGPGSTRAFADDGGRPSLPAGEAGGIPWGAEAERMAPAEYAQLYQQAMGQWGPGSTPAASSTWVPPEPSQYPQDSPPFVQYDYSRNPPVPLQVDPYAAPQDYPPQYSQQPVGYDARYVPDTGSYGFPYPPQPNSQLPELPGPPSVPYESIPPYLPETSYGNPPAAYQLPGGSQPAAGPPDAYSQPPSAPTDRNAAPERQRRPQGGGRSKFEVVDDWE